MNVIIHGTADNQTRFYTLLLFRYVFRMQHCNTMLSVKLRYYHYYYRTYFSVKPT